MMDPSASASSSISPTMFVGPSHQLRHRTPSPRVPANVPARRHEYRHSPTSITMASASETLVGSERWLDDKKSSLAYPKNAKGGYTIQRHWLSPGDLHSATSIRIVRAPSSTYSEDTYSSDGRSSRQSGSSHSTNSSSTLSHRTYSDYSYASSSTRNSGHSPPRKREVHRSESRQKRPEQLLEKGHDRQAPISDRVASQSDIQATARPAVPSDPGHSKLTAKFPLPPSIRSRMPAQGTSHRRLMQDALQEDYSGRPLFLVERQSSSEARAREKVLALETAERKARWTNAKWLLMLSVFTLFAYGAAGLVMALLTWHRAWTQADVVVVAENDIMIYITLASSMCLLTSLLGLTGTMLNSRPILAFYNLLLWPSLAAVLVVGYSAYNKQALNLDQKLNQAWSQFFDDAARLRIQNNLRCCGYYSPLHEATFSKRCYPRTSLPGCKGKLLRFEKDILEQIATYAFAVVPVHLFNTLVALLCSNHVDRTFGKGLMPRQYRLSMMDVRENAISVLNSLPSQPDAAVRSARDDLSTLRRPTTSNSLMEPAYETYSSASSSSSRSSEASTYAEKPSRRRQRRNSVETLASMSHAIPSRGLQGLGLGVGGGGGGGDWR